MDYHLAPSVPLSSRFSGLRSQMETMVDRVEQVMTQTRARVFGGNTKFDEKLVSVFEPQTEIIRKSYPLCLVES